MSTEIPQDKIKEKKEELEKKQADLQTEVKDLQSQCALIPMIKSDITASSMSRCALIADAWMNINLHLVILATR